MLKKFIPVKIKMLNKIISQRERINCNNEIPLSAIMEQWSFLDYEDLEFFNKPKKGYIQLKLWEERSY